MAVQQMSQLRLKAVVSVSEMAKMVKLSRARFYDLVKQGTFLQPVYSLINRRPCYTAEMQQENLLARQTGIGCNGMYTLFYERKPSQPRPEASSPRPTASRADYSSIIEGLRSLGMDGVTTVQVEEAVASSFPNGTQGIEGGYILRAVFRYLRHLDRG